MLNTSKIFITVFFFCCFIAHSFAQNTSWDAARILLELEKLNTTGSVLYMAAHPDDENTRLITYFANEKKVRTGYLSLTRGDGGQNLVGEEQGAYLGLLRTQELLEARKTDGGEQYFTTAVDFGYSKTADETFTVWNHDRLLEEAVWIIRNFQPDIIITRFPPDERAGHGQHTVSAIIAQEAFIAAADPEKFPEQLQFVKPWKTQRLFWNTSLRWDNTLAEKLKDKKNVGIIDVGGYNPLLGYSYGEIAADSRTHHKSQGFGSAPSRGEQLEYLTLTDGSGFEKDIFEDIITTWERYRMGSEVQMMIQQIMDAYDIRNPAASIPQLIALYRIMENLPQQNATQYKLQQLENIILACGGIWLEPVAIQDMISAGDAITIINNMIVRNNVAAELQSITVNDSVIPVQRVLSRNNNYTDTLIISVPENSSSTPYWLIHPYAGFFKVDDWKLIGKAENDPAIMFAYNMRIAGQEFHITRGVVYKETDAVDGEIIKPLAIVPELTVNFAENVYVFGNDKPQKIYATIKAFEEVENCSLTLELPSGWTSPEIQKIITLKKGESMQAEFVITPPAAASSAMLKITYAVKNAAEKQVAKKITTIDHKHIMRQVVIENAEIKLVKVQTEIPQFKIAYIEGAGDKVYESMLQLGLNVTMIDPKNITLAELAQYTVIVSGIRAYNTSKSLADAQHIIKDYIAQGGIYIMQYNTSWDLYTTDFAPYPFTISRGRVTDENSKVDFLLKDHPVLQYPNVITADDFNNWVQERGLYFASDIDMAYKAPLAFTDPGEQAQTGALIIADYGKGAFIYTGISFFRELPAGVPGAVRLFINIISYNPSTQ